MMETSIEGEFIHSPSIAARHNLPSSEFILHGKFNHSYYLCALPLKAPLDVLALPPKKHVNSTRVLDSESSQNIV